MDYQTLTLDILAAQRPDLMESLTARARETAQTELAPKIEQARQEGDEAGHARGLTEGRAEGASAERERITAIEALAMPGHETLIAEAKADPTATAASVSVKIVEAEKARNANALEARRGDETAEDPPAVDPKAGSLPTKGTAIDSKALAARTRKIVDEVKADGGFITVAAAAEQAKAEMLAG